jgi:release factor glutamine methyltransferase
MLLKKNKDNKKNKLAGLLNEACSLFKNKKLKVPEMEAQLLMAHILKRDRVFVIAHPDYLLKPKEIIQFNKLVKARFAGWSSAVLLGTKEFYGLEFKVNKDVLVPRPETEILVDIILEYLKSKPETLIMDIGTGSGAIITSLYSNLQSKRHLFYASDKSNKALIIAKSNAKKYQTKIGFLNGDLLKPYLPILKKTKPQNIVIAANLPYLKPSEMSESSIRKEPKSALLSGSDGLWHYRRLFSQLNCIKNSKVFLICEINHEQAQPIEKLAHASLPKSLTHFKNDYTGRIRFFILEF